MDLQLLVLFEALIQDCNVTRTAERVCLSQPTVSASLARLRRYFGDPLLVRYGRSMVPTSRALDILSYLSPALDTLSSAMGKSAPFSSLTNAKTYRIGMSDDVELALMPSLIQVLRQAAPTIKVVVVPVDCFTVSEMLSNGAITMAVTPLRNLPANCKQRYLRRVSSYVLRAGAPRSKLDIGEFCRRPHVLVSPLSDTRGVIDDVLANQGMQRDVVMTIPKYSPLPALLAENHELIAVLPEHAARVLARYTGLTCDPVPLVIPACELSIAWPVIHDANPAEKWLRSVVIAHLSQ